MTEQTEERRRDKAKGGGREGGTMVRQCDRRKREREQGSTPGIIVPVIEGNEEAVDM